MGPAGGAGPHHESRLWIELFLSAMFGFPICNVFRKEKKTDTRQLCRRLCKKNCVSRGAAALETGAVELLEQPVAVDMRRWAACVISPFIAQLQPLWITSGFVRDTLSLSWPDTNCPFLSTLDPCPTAMSLDAFRQSPIGVGFLPQTVRGGRLQRGGLEQWGP